MAAEIDHIEIRPDSFGWTVRIVAADANYEFGIGDAMQWAHETDRTLGKWLADGPADFHGTADTLRDSGFSDAFVDLATADPDLVRDLERGK